MGKVKETRGRKPLDPANRKKQVSFYTEAHYIKSKGGMAKVQEACKKLIES